jgi:hypothetical protein
MNYKTYHLITLVLLRLAGVSIIALGVERKFNSVEPIWWFAIGWGIVVFVASLVFVGFTVTPTSEMTCPDSESKVIARVGSGLNSGHLYLTQK